MDLEKKIELSDLARWFSSPGHRREYAESIPDFSKLTSEEQDNILYNLMSGDVYWRGKAQAEKLFKQKWETLLNENVKEEDIQKRVVFIEKNSIGFLNKSKNSKKIGSEIKDRMNKGNPLCAYMDGDNKIHLFRYGTVNFPCSFQGGAEFIIERSMIHEVPEKERIEALQDFGFSKEGAEKLLNATSEQWKTKGFIEQTKKEKAPVENVNTDSLSKSAENEEWKEKIDSLWETVHGASLWWKNSGDYTNMHNKLKEIRKYMDKNGNSIGQNDPKLQKMIQDMTESTVAYLKSKNPKEMASGSNADKRYKAAQAVLNKFGSKAQKIEAKIVEGNEPKPQAEVQEAQAKAQEPQAEAQEPQVEAQEPQAEAQESQAVKSDVVNPMPDHEYTKGDIDWIFWKLKKDGILDKDVTKKDLLMGVIMSAGKGKEPCRQILTGLEKVGEQILTGSKKAEEKGLTEETRNLLKENVSDWCKRRDEARGKQSLPQIGIHRLYKFNRILNEAGSQDEYWRVGASILSGLGPGLNGNFSPLKGWKNNSGIQKQEMKIKADSGVLMMENRFLNKASQIPITRRVSSGEKDLIKETDLPLYITAELMKNDRDKRTSNGAQGQEMDKLNVLYCLTKDGGDKFAENVYNNILKGYIEKNPLKMDKSGTRYELDEIKTILEENKNELNKKLQDYCKERVDAMKKEVADKRSNEVKEVSNKDEKVKAPEKTVEQKKKAQSPVM